MFSSDRDQLRNVFFECWRKYQERLPLEPVESQLLDVILLHPEYHNVLSDPDNFRAHDFGEANPFLHMSLHLALREQVNTNRPVGIEIIHHKLVVKYQDLHVAEHHMIECLANVLWQAQQDGKMPDEKNYLMNLKRLL